jgi:hypothetical protein
MRMIIAVLACLLLDAAAPTFAADKITYFACKADNENEASVFGLDDTAQKVCDRSVETLWFSPGTFDASKVIWSDGLYTKAIYRGGKDKRYERDLLLLLVHTGHCDKVQPATSQSCKSP